MAEYYPVELTDDNVKSYDILTQLLPISAVTSSNVYSVEIRVNPVTEEDADDGIELHLFITNYNEHQDFVKGVVETLSNFNDYTLLQRGIVTLAVHDTDDNITANSVYDINVFRNVLDRLFDRNMES